MFGEYSLVDLTCIVNTAMVGKKLVSVDKLDGTGTISIHQPIHYSTVLLLLHFTVFISPCDTSYY